MTTQSAWLHAFPGGQAAQADLVCLPHVGGSASFFFPLARLLAPHIRVLGVQYPGRQERHREPVLTDVRELADGVLAALATRVPDRMRSTILFGHSLGAIVAYEIALRQTPARLVVSARRAPSRYRDEQVHKRDDAGVIAELRRLSGTDAQLLADPEMVELMLPLVRGDYEAIETYRHSPAAAPLSCPVTVLMGDADPMVDHEEAEAWQRHTEHPVDLQVYPGGHFYLIEHLTEVAELMRKLV